MYYSLLLPDLRNVRQPLKYHTG